MRPVTASSLPGVWPLLIGPGPWSNQLRDPQTWRNAEALQRLRQAADQARNLARQQEAADALRRLADEMARNGDRPAANRPAGPPPPTDADELRRLSGNGNLPTERDAEAARDLARRQRQLRDVASEASAELSRGVEQCEILGGEIADFHHAQGERIAEREHRGG